MRRSNAPTLQDVADEAGVTAMMASVVLNGAKSSTRVSPVTRARILEVAARLQYHRNDAAHGLSHHRMHTLGVVFIIAGGEINFYFLELLNGILEAGAAHDQSVTIFSIADWQKEEPKLLQFYDGRVDGLILIAPDLAATFAEKIPQHTPFVTLHSNGARLPTWNIDTDNEGGAYAMTRHLIAQGHRRILHLPGEQDRIGAQQRLDGYRRALESAAIPYDPSLVVPGSFSVSSGLHRMKELLAHRPPDPFPTALFCGSDAIAAGCMEVLESYGFRIPDDISVAGFDDTLMARMTAPPLTTVRQPFRQMGRRAVELLLLQIHDDPMPTKKETPPPSILPQIPTGATEIFTAELVLRASVGPPPGRINPALESKA